MAVTEPETHMVMLWNKYHYRKKNLEQDLQTLNNCLKEEIVYPAKLQNNTTI